MRADCSSVSVPAMLSPSEERSAQVNSAPFGVVSMAFTSTTVPFVRAGAHAYSVTEPPAGIVTTYSFEAPFTCSFSAGSPSPIVILIFAVTAFTAWKVTL